MRARRRLPFLIFLLAAIASAKLHAQPAHPEFWRDQSIYQIFTDRFCDGDPSNNNADGNYHPNRANAPHGGDFRGVEQKLDYVKALGATAIWISPVVLNGRGEYHGYAGRDFFKVDPRWGTMEDLRQMVDAAHKRGILVIDDVVVNHGADLIDSGDPGYGAFLEPPSGYHLRYRDPARTYPPPFDLNATNPELTNLFHNQGLIHDYHVADQYILGELSGLDDFRTESPYVRAQMERICQFWIEQAGFDGFRIDTVKHVEPGFWREWCPAIRSFAAAHGRPDFFMFGEVLDGADKLCGSFTGVKDDGAHYELDSVLDYPLYFKIQNVFARAKVPTAQIEERYQALAERYDPTARDRLVTFLDNHDQPRFLSGDLAGDRADRLKVALVFLYTSRGIPCLYYGTEQAFAGGNDPYDREDMFAGAFKVAGPAGADSFNMTHPLFQWVALLNNLRRLYTPLRQGEHINLWCDHNGPGLLAYARRQGADEVIVALNTAGQPQTLPERPTALAPGTRVINSLDTNEILTVTPDGKTPPITVPATAAKIFVAQSQWRPLDPAVISSSPLHDAKDVPVSQAITLSFSEAMDTNSVQSAFATEPATSGAFTWPPGRDSVTYTTALPQGKIVYVRLAGAARAAASGNPLHAPFESRFQTR